MKAWIADDYGPPSHLRVGEIDFPVARNGVPSARECMCERREVRYIQNDPQPGDLSELARLASSGELRIEIATTYPFSEAPKALADLLDPAMHTRGKLVVMGA